MPYHHSGNITMQKKIQSALISVYYKDGLDTIIHQLNKLGVTFYSRFMQTVNFTAITSFLC